MCDITAAVVAGTAVAGAAASASSKPKGQTQTSTQTREPWEPQKEFIYQTFEDAQNLYTQTRDRGAYQGDTSAGMNDLTREGLGGAVDYRQAALPGLSWGHRRASSIVPARWRRRAPDR